MVEEVSEVEEVHKVARRSCKVAKLVKSAKLTKCEEAWHSMEDDEAGEVFAHELEVRKAGFALEFLMSSSPSVREGLMIAGRRVLCF